VGKILELTHRNGLLLCDVEEGSVELGEVTLHEVTALVVEGTRLLRGGMVVGIARETFRRNFGQPSLERESRVQKSSSVETSPDRRQDMPTMAMGASLGAALSVAAIV
jgi:hypothetical protein